MLGGIIKENSWFRNKYVVNIFYAWPHGGAAQPKILSSLAIVMFVRGP